MSSASLLDTQYFLKKRLSDEGIEPVLLELNHLLHHERPAFNDFVQLKTNFNAAKKQYLVYGTIEYKGEFEKVSNRTTQGLLLLLDQLQTPDLRPPDDFDPLIQELRALPIDRDKVLMPVSLVNCDRTDASKTYRSAKRQKMDTPLHFFLVQACPLQMPHSFAERMIWEEVMKLDSDPDAQFYFKPNGPERILIQALPVEEGDAEASLHAFKSEFSRAHGEFFQKKYSHAAFGCALHEKNWDDSLPECLTAMLQWLGEVAGKGRRLFAFFLVVYIEKLDQVGSLQPRQTRILEQLSALVQQHSAVVTDISLKLTDIPGEASGSISLTRQALLHPVPGEEVEKWLHRIALYGQAPNVNQILEQFDRYVEKNAPDRYRKGGPYAMRDVQELQKMTRKLVIG